jgi:membrane protein implicated in regulation of membrane protease activity
MIKFIKTNKALLLGFITGFILAAFLDIPFWYELALLIVIAIVANIIWRAFIKQKDK